MSIEAVARPLLEAEMLPPASYTSEAAYAAEMEHIFGKSWLFAGDVARLEHPGDYWSLTLAGVPVLVLRDRDGAIRAFANTCRHRGCRLVPPGNGNRRAIKCGYHGWVYGLDGKLMGAPQMEHTTGFEKADYGLHPVRSAVWGPFLFLSLDRAAPPFEETLGDFCKLFDGYPLDQLIVARRAAVTVKCNWKVYAENLMESYHIPYVHAASIAGNDYDPGMEALAGKGKGVYGETPGEPVWLDFGRSHAAIVSRHTGSNALLPTDKGFPAMPGLTGVAAEGSHFAYPFPCALLAGNIDCLWYVAINPLAPDSTELTLAHLFHRETRARPDFDAVVPAYYRRLDTATDEDVVMTEEQHQGLSSPLARAGRLSHMEPIVHAFRRWIVDRIGGQPL
ncbi:MAG: aromatic ring-hydroxylating dioxygenase subunit alpha [Alphaproteobacteria bacterium]